MTRLISLDTITCPSCYGSNHNLNTVYTTSLLTHTLPLLRFQPQFQYSIYHKSPDPHINPVTVPTTILIQYIPQVSWPICCPCYDSNHNLNTVYTTSLWSWPTLCPCSRSKLDFKFCSWLKLGSRTELWKTKSCHWPR